MQELPSSTTGAAGRSGARARSTNAHVATATALTTLACLFMENTWAQLALMLTYLAMYIWLYQALVNFNSPKFMTRRR